MSTWEGSQQMVTVEQERKEAQDFVQIYLKQTKKSLDLATFESKEAEKKLHSALTEVKSRRRTLSLVSQEIKKHCCTCGGLHVSHDHEPYQNPTCKRLHEKKLSYNYLKNALKDAESNADRQKKNVDQMQDKKEKVCEELNVTLDHGFRLLDVFG